MALRYDKAILHSDKAITTPEGYLKADSVVTRTGIFIYRNADGSIRRELRHPDEVFKADSLATLKMIPLTNEHPASMVNTDNINELSAGHAGEDVKTDSDNVKIPLLFTRKDAIEAITSKSKTELSCGYVCDMDMTPGVWNGEKYDAMQKNIRYNHIALVSAGRAGAIASIKLDSAYAVQIDSKDGEYTMSMKKIHLDGVEYEAEGRVLEELSRKDSAMKDLSEKVSKLEAERDSFKEKFDSIEAENKKLKEESISKEKMDAAIKEHLSVREAAKRVCEDSVVEKLDEMDLMDVKKAVIMASCPSAKLDGKDDVYINARFDSVVDSFVDEPEIKVNPAVTVRGDAKDREIKLDSKGLAAKYREDLENAWKVVK